MRKIMFMVVSLTAITAICGLALGALNSFTAPVIFEQQLRTKQVPAAQKVFPDATNDLLADHQKMPPPEGSKNETILFPARKSAGGEVYGVAFEATGKGYGGDVGVIVGFDLTKNTISGAAVSAHGETPGLGARAATEDGFVSQFRDRPLDGNFAVKQDGGTIDAISGATKTSRAVCHAVTQAVAFFQEHEEEIRRLASGGGGQ